MINESIEVFLRRVGPRPTRFLEYTRQGYVQKFKSQHTQAYVEATADERFQVHIRLHQGFRYFTATGIEVRLWLDAHEEPDVYFHKRVLVPSDLRRSYVEYVLDDFAIQAGDHWENGQLCFGEVQVDDERDKRLRNSELKERSKKLGSIRVSVQRGRQDGELVYVPEPESVQLDGYVSSKDRNEGISHCVKTINNSIIDTPESDAALLFKPVIGPHGERYRFDFHYRSREELQNLGIMDEHGKRIDPVVGGDEDDESPIAPSRAIKQEDPPIPGPLQPPVSRIGISSTLLQHTTPSQGSLFVSPTSGLSSSSSIERHIRSLWKKEVSQKTPTQQHPRKGISATQKSGGASKKRLLSPTENRADGFSGSPSKKQRPPLIDLTGSPSPTLPSSNAPVEGPRVGAASAATSRSLLEPSLPRQGTTTAVNKSTLPFSPPLTARQTPSTPTLHAHLFKGTMVSSLSPSPTAPSSSRVAHTPHNVGGLTDQVNAAALGSESVDINSYAGSTTSGNTDDANDDDGEDMTEAEMQLQVRRMEMKQREFEIEQQQLANQQRLMEMQLKLERKKRLQKQGGDNGGP